MRKIYIDNLRNYTILLLFPVHTFMVWNDFGSRFYVWMGESRLLSTLIVLVNPWFMPLLFVLAGISARHALEQRSRREYVKQRARPLLVPCLGGLLLLGPFQSLFARKFFFEYQGGLASHWHYFFTHLTDFSGYDGAFTPGHLWFILFLFLISMVSLAIFCILPQLPISLLPSAGRTKGKAAAIPFGGLLLLFLPVWLMYYLGNFGGFSLGKNLALFLLGYYYLSQDSVLECLEQHAGWLLSLWTAVTLLSVLLYYRFAYYGDLWVNLVGWISILSLLVLGRRFLDKPTAVTKYLNRMSYPIYLLHQTILVALAYYMARISLPLPALAASICIGSLLLTLAACHLLRHIPLLRLLAGFS